MKKFIVSLSFVLTASLIGCFPLSSHAQEDIMYDDNTNGKELLKYCAEAQKTSTDNYLALGFCLGRVSGATSYLSYAHASGVQKEICLPPDMRAGKEIEIVVRYLKQNPKTLHYGATSLIHQAFAEAYPCNTL